MFDHVLVLLHECVNIADIGLHHVIPKFLVKSTAAGEEGEAAMDRWVGYVAWKRLAMETMPLPKI